MIDRNIKMLMPEPYQSAHDGYLENYLSSNKPRIIGLGREVVGLRKDGTHVPPSVWRWAGSTCQASSCSLVS